MLGWKGIYNSNIQSVITTIISSCRHTSEQCAYIYLCLAYKGNTVMIRGTYAISYYTLVIEVFLQFFAILISGDQPHKIVVRSLNCYI